MSTVEKRPTDDRPILVTGASGTHGGTGGFIVKQLLARGVSVRALVRVDDERAAALRALGAEVVVADLHEPRALAPALRGVSAAYFAYPVKAGVVEAAASFASAARAAELPRLVVMSMVIAHPEHPSPFARAHWLAEEIFGWAGIPTLSLRIAALFFENLFLLHGEEIRGDGRIRNSFADVPVPWMSGEDAAKIATAALLYPGRFGGERGVVYPTGGAPQRHSDVLRAMGERTGRDLRHETIPVAEWASRLVSLSDRDRRVNPFMAKHIAETGAALSKPRAGGPPRLLAFEDLTGDKPATVDEVLRGVGARVAT